MQSSTNLITSLIKHKLDDIYSASIKNRVFELFFISVYQHSAMRN